MPVYAYINPFMGLVRTANPTFERVKRSSLRPLIDILNSPAGNAAAVRPLITALPVDKTNQYLEALYYLFATYPGLAAHAADLHLAQDDTTEAVRYPLTAVPGNFRPADQHARNQIFVTPVSARTGLTLEQYILINGATTSVELIHLSSHQPPMDQVFAGKSCVNHIKSVLQVANWMGCPVCCLTMEAGSNVTPELRVVYNGSNSTRALVQDGHMGTIDAGLRNFVTQRANLVVMGFDGSVCVFANVFGGNEYMAPLTPIFTPPFRPPLASLANVVMSRAGIVSNGPLYSPASSTFGNAEYGFLCGKG